MSEPRGEYPQPVTDADNRPFLEGWAEGRLMLQTCGGCGRVFFYPRPLCPHCWSDKLAWHAASGRGKVVSFSLIYRPNHPSFFDEVPIILAEVELAEQVPILARIVEVEADAMRLGLEVELLAPRDAPRYPLPTFRARSSGRTA